MSAVTTFKRILNQFTEDTESLALSEAFKTQFGNTKKILTALMLVDTHTDKDTEKLLVAVKEVDSLLETWIEKLVVLQGKEKEKGGLKPKMTEFQVKLGRLVQEYKQKANPTPKDNGKAGKQSPGLDEKLGRQRLQEALDKLKAMRELELDSQEKLNARMKKQLMAMIERRTEAEKLLKQAEQAASGGDKERVYKLAELIHRIAEEADETALRDYKAMDTDQKKYESYRNGLNWKSVLDDYEFGKFSSELVKEFEKAYAKSVRQYAGMYSKAIQLGSSSIESSDATKQVAGEITAIAEQCVALTKTANQLKAFTLTDLMSPTGKTTYAFMLAAFDVKAKNGVDQLISKLTKNTESLEKDIVTFETVRDPISKDSAVEAARIHNDNIDMTLLELRDGMNRAKMAFESGKRRIPKELTSDPHVKQALMKLGTLLVERQQSINLLRGTAEKHKTKAKELGMQT